MTLVSFERAGQAACEVGLAGCCARLGIDTSGGAGNRCDSLPYVQDDDMVEADVIGLGILSNRIGTAA